MAQDSANQQPETVRVWHFASPVLGMQSCGYRLAVVSEERREREERGEEREEWK